MPCHGSFRDATLLVNEAVAILKGVSEQGGEAGAVAVFETERGSWLYTFGLRQFVRRVWEFTSCDANTMLCSFMLLDKVAASIEINERNVQKMWFTALLLCIKFMEDHYLADPAYAEICDVPTAALFAMQTAMLNALDWNVHVEASLVKIFVGRWRSVWSCARRSRTAACGAKPLCTPLRAAQ
eukprot:TRINITY_DN716_c0_g1_i3.p3 TRINITY_DN716_c0_g1~~TRINITY_DN716_c0_g1_i3.p3  ORF type:complete len:183 (+),score=43.95 TRINITY_DN716_c0_g1_i3:72-620(+)